MNTDVLIVGGGLAGLALAMQLQRAGRDYLLVEARARLGGRILSLRSQGGDDPAARYDLGPAWYWPGQPKMARLVSALGLAVFEQYAEGKLVFQDRDGAIQRDLDFATMAGSLRITGGITSLIDKLAQGIPAHRMRLRAKVVKLALAADGVGATLVTESGAVQIQSNKAVLALPPRLAAASITFAPDPGSAALHTMRTIPTWMAGHAKIIAVYEQPFWRAAGLSGDGISHRGPLAEVHDASPASGSEGALFGFVAEKKPPDADGEHNGQEAELKADRAEDFAGLRVHAERLGKVAGQSKGKNSAFFAMGERRKRGDAERGLGSLHHLRA